MKKILIAAALGLPLLASAQNLLANGSFENGLTGWTLTESASTTISAAVLSYGSTPGAFGEIVPADNNLANRSPDAVGTQGLYFVDDLAVQTLSQRINVAADGLFNLGISGYLPANGAANAGDAVLTVNIGTLTASLTLGSLTPQTWLSYNAVLPLTAGIHELSLSFATTGGLSKDLVLDRAYVAAVPEPGTYALLLAGLGMVGLMAARRRG